MHTFAQKTSATQEAKSGHNTKRGRLRSISRQQPTAENQAVERLLQSDVEELGDGSTTSTLPRFAHDFSLLPVYAGVGNFIQPKLKVNALGDKYEQEADRVAGQVMRMPEERLQRLRNCGGECPKRREKQSVQRLQAKVIGDHAVGETAASSLVQRIISSSGQSLGSKTREFMESRFGNDFSRVRVHTDARAGAAAAAVNAHAFTVGRAVVFGEGQYRPETDAGRRLLAHELTHVIQQGTAKPIHETSSETAGTAERETQVNGRGGANTDHTESVSIRHVTSAKLLQRYTPAAVVDPLCADYVYFIEKIIIEGQIEDLKATPDVEKRLELIRELKWILRCGTDAEKSEIKDMLGTGLGEKEGVAVWKEAGTPFGGYRGAYPGYYGGAKGRLERLGTSEVEAYEAFAYDPTSSPSATFISGRETAATAEAPSLVATDILYFYGHQYAQYSAPGVFANGIQTQFIDLRALAGKGDFGRVKLIVSTSCATICKEAIEIFAPLFPNAVLLGYRKSAPINGKAVRNNFDKGIRGLKRPLLLEEPVDVNAIIDVWKSVIKRHHPNENTRLPGYYQNGTVHYLENGTWQSMPATDIGNTCRKKGERIEEAAH